MIACVDLPSLPLQWVWRQQPAWRQQPVVIVDEDRPSGTVLWACERARQKQVLPGHRYAAALGLCSGLRATVMEQSHLAQLTVELAEVLSNFSPNVEVATDYPGSFWLDGSGLRNIFVDGDDDTPGTAWAKKIQASLAAIGFQCVVVVGFSRFATYAIAKASKTNSRQQWVVFASDEQERTFARQVPLERLDIDPRLRDSLARLGVTTLGQMLRLPSAGILERFGKAAYNLYQLANGQKWDPLVATKQEQSVVEQVLLDEEDDNVERLMFVIKGALDRLIASIAKQHNAVVTLHTELQCKISVGEVVVQTETVNPASPTLDSSGLARLIHLRLSGSSPPKSAVIGIRLWADVIRATQQQLSLFAQAPKRDLRAGNEALARLRAEFGEQAVVRAVLRPGHLPEASFGWQPVREMQTAAPAQPLIHPMVRRVASKPLLLPPQSTSVRNDGWLLSGLEHGAVVNIVGPYVVSGGWWAAEVHREYHYAQTRRGDCLWVYFDRNRRRWFLHGAVE